jgi:hypothetical protein
MGTVQYRVAGAEQSKVQSLKLNTAMGLIV